MTTAVDRAAAGRTARTCCRCRMRPSRLAVPSVLVAAAVVTSALPSLATEAVSTRRLAGPDRYATAAAIAQATWPARGDERRAYKAVVARGDAFPDALAGVNVVGVQDGPVLLTPFADAPQATLDTIRELDAELVTILGETDVVSARVEQQVNDVLIGHDASRTAGRDRYETAARAYTSTYDCYSRIPAQVDGSKTAFLTSGLQFADAVAAGPIAFGEDVPLLLTAPDRLPLSTQEALAYEGDGPEGSGCGDRQIEQVVIVGGEAVVSPDVAQQLVDLGYAVRRVSGRDRQETAVRLFEFAEAEFAWEMDHVNLARGDGFADAIAGGPHAGKEQAPVLLTVGVDDLGPVTREFLRSRAQTISSIDVFGDATAISDAVVADAQRAATSD